MCDFVIVAGTICSILGYRSACDLGILEITFSVSKPAHKMASQNQDKGQHIFDKYPHLFRGIGKMKDIKVKLYIDKYIHPVKQLHQ